MSPDQPTTMETLLWHPIDMEGSSNSEGSQATGDSGRYSHDETEMANLSSGLSSHPPSLMAEDSGGSECSGPAAELGGPLKGGQTDEKECVEDGSCHQDTPSSLQLEPSLRVRGCVAE